MNLIKKDNNGKQEINGFKIELMGCGDDGECTFKIK